MIDKRERGGTAMSSSGAHPAMTSAVRTAQAGGPSLCKKANRPGSTNEGNLFPIGSVCVNLFEVEELNVSVSVLRGLFELRAAFDSRKPVTLTSDYFSRALLADLWENGAFPSNGYNRGNGENDYKFLVDMFNSHHEPTTKENRKIWVLVNKTTKPFVLADDRLG